MNDSKTAHRFKNKESERRSTRRRTDDPLDADKASHPWRGRRRCDPTRRARRARPTLRGGAARCWRLAVSGWEHRRQLGQHAVLPLPDAKALGWLAWSGKWIP